MTNRLAVQEITHLPPYLRPEPPFIPPAMAGDYIDIPILYGTDLGELDVQTLHAFDKKTA